MVCRGTPVSTVRAAFDVLAPRHQSFVDNSQHDLYTLRLRELLLPYLEAVPRDRPILDVGCGSGQWAYWINQRGLPVHSFDLSWNMVLLAHQTAPHIPHFEMDTTCIGLADRYYSCALGIGDVFSYVQNIEQALCEIKRVTIPGATLVGTVISTGGVLVNELARSNYSRVNRLIENGTWVERTVEELRQLVSDDAQRAVTESLNDPLVVNSYTSEKLRSVLSNTARVLTIKGLGVLRRLDTKRVKVATVEQMELERKLSESFPWLDISTNLFFAVRFD